MPSLKKFFRPASYFRYIPIPHFWANLRGVTFNPPGHFYSPLIDIEAQAPGASAVEFDGAGLWEHIDLREPDLRAYHSELITRHSAIPFPEAKRADFRYFSRNGSFVLSDASTLSSIIQKERPRRIIEVGSGFSSAVMLDTASRSPLRPAFTFIEPYPRLLQSLITSDDATAVTILPQRVQEVPLSVFDQLESQDILFIDSSHVAKVGSDVVFLLLRVLPRLQPGVFLHFHDIFYPWSYPMPWIRQGCAWNESLFLRALLVGGDRYQIMAFNCYAGYTFPEVFRTHFPEFLDNTGGSLWLRKMR